MLFIKVVEYEYYSQLKEFSYYEPMTNQISLIREETSKIPLR